MSYYIEVYAGGCATAWMPVDPDRETQYDTKEEAEIAIQALRRGDPDYECRITEVEEDEE